jgi:mono/diheme cytochrome c family protein
MRRLSLSFVVILALLTLLLQPRLLVAGEVAAGRALYQQYCGMCHGPQGKGNGPAAAAMNPKPRDHTDGPYMNALSDTHLTKVLREGGAAVQLSPLMPAWKETLSLEEAVARGVSGLPSEAMLAAALQESS